MKKSLVLFPLFIATLTVLTACGGGGGSTPVANSASAAATYPITTILANYVNNSSTVKINISGTVSAAGQTYPISGAGSMSERTTSSTFGGTSALMKTQTITGSMTVTANGQSQILPLNGVDYIYYSSNYQPLGRSSSDSYCVTTNVSSLPVVASPGQAGEWYRMNCYTNSNRAVSIGTNVVSYSLTAVSSSTANLSLMQTITDTTGRIISAGLPLPTDTYLITSSGAISYKESKANVISSEGVIISLIITAI